MAARKKKEEAEETPVIEVAPEAVEEPKAAPEVADQANADEPAVEKAEKPKKRAAPKKKEAQTKDQVKGEVITEPPVEEKAEKPKKRAAPKKKEAQAKDQVKGEVITEPPVEEKPEKPKKRPSPKKKEEASVEEGEDIPEPPVEEAAAEAVPEEDAEPAEGEEKGAKKKRAKKEEKKEEGPGREQLMFGRYNVKDVIVEDPGLKLLINLDPAFVPHSSARHANKPFYKSKISIVERLINGMMRTENYTGKKTKSYRAVLNAFEIIEEKTKENPIQVYVRALENSAPREEVTRLKFGGISVPKAVDTSPARRLDVSIRNITVGSIKASHKNKKTIAQCLASELIAASKNDQQSYAISKKDELERVAKSAH